MAHTGGTQKWRFATCNFFGRWFLLSYTPVSRAGSAPEARQEAIVPPMTFIKLFLTSYNHGKDMGNFSDDYAGKHGRIQKRAAAPEQGNRTLSMFTVRSRGALLQTSSGDVQQLARDGLLTRFIVL